MEETTIAEIPFVAVYDINTDSESELYSAADKAGPISGVKPFW